MTKDKSEIILIVDDQSEDRLILNDIVNHFFPSFRTILLGDSSQVLATAEEHQPQVILLDWIMPDKDGLEVLTMLKANPATADIPVIMVTTYSSSEKLKEAFDNGVSDFISKPVNPDEIFSRIRSVLMLNKAMQQLKQQKKELEEITSKLTKANEQLELLSLVARHTTNSVVIISKDGTLEWANQSFLDYYHCDLEQFKAKYGTTIFEVSHNTSIADDIKRCIEQKIPVHYVTYWDFSDPDKNYYKKKWIQTTLTPVVATDGQILKVIAIESDITQLKEYEEELIQQKENLQTLNENLQRAYELLEKSRKDAE